MTTVVTTFGKTGKFLYGDNFIESFIKYWPKEINLVIYKEDWEPTVYAENIIYKDIDLEIPEINIFRDHCMSMIDSIIKKDKKSKRINWYNKAIRWSFKSLVMYKELQIVDSRYLIWLDGDVVTLKSPPLDIAEKIIKDKAFASQLEIIKGNKHCESGIVIFNTQHNQCERIISHLKEGYINFKILTLEKPWDGFWLAKMLEQGIEFLDMNKQKRGIAKTFNNVNITGILRHNIGNRKFKDNNLHAITGRQIDESW